MLSTSNDLLGKLDDPPGPEVARPGPGDVDREVDTWPGERVAEGDAEMVEGGGGEPDRKLWVDVEAVMDWVVGIPGVGEEANAVRVSDAKFLVKLIQFGPPVPSAPTAFPSPLPSPDPACAVGGGGLLLRP